MAHLQESLSKFVDLTTVENGDGGDDGDDDSREDNAPPEDFEPVGVDICVDVVDIADSDSEEDQNRKEATTSYAAQKTNYGKNMPPPNKPKRKHQKTTSNKKSVANEQSKATQNNQCKDKETATQRQNHGSKKRGNENHQDTREETKLAQQQGGSPKKRKRRKRKRKRQAGNPPGDKMGSATQETGVVRGAQAEGKQVKQCQTFSTETGTKKSQKRKRKHSKAKDPAENKSTSPPRPRKKERISEQQQHNCRHKAPKSLEDEDEPVGVDISVDVVDLFDDSDEDDDNLAASVSPSIGTQASPLKVPQPHRNCTNHDTKAISSRDASSKKMPKKKVSFEHPPQTSRNGKNRAANEIGENNTGNVRKIMQSQAATTMQRKRNSERSTRSDLEKSQSSVWPTAHTKNSTKQTSVHQKVQHGKDATKSTSEHTHEKTNNNSPHKRKARSLSFMPDMNQVAAKKTRGPRNADVIDLVLGEENDNKPPPHGTKDESLLTETRLNGGRACASSTTSSLECSHKQGRIPPTSEARASISSSKSTVKSSDSFQSSKEETKPCDDNGKHTESLKKDRTEIPSENYKKPEVANKGAKLSAVKKEPTQCLEENSRKSLHGANDDVGAAKKETNQCLKENSKKPIQGAPDDAKKHVHSQVKSEFGSDVKFSSCRNFIFIDISDDESDVECYEPKTKVKNEKKPDFKTKACHNKTRPNKAIPKRQSSGNKAKTRGVARGVAHVFVPFREDKDFSYNFSRQAAEDMQERLLRESAARVRSRVDGCSSDPRQVDFNIPQTFFSPVIDVHQRYPNHWTWRDPYARLGLPNQASAALVKTHYRKLALIYHPDKMKFNDSGKRFHAITAAYRKLISRISND